MGESRTVLIKVSCQFVSESWGSEDVRLTVSLISRVFGDYIFWFGTKDVTMIDVKLRMHLRLLIDGGK